jgi:hypothetical protein
LKVDSQKEEEEEEEEEEEVVVVMRVHIQSTCKVEAAHKNKYLIAE